MLVQLPFVVLRPFTGEGVQPGDFGCFAPKSRIQQVAETGSEPRPAWPEAPRRCAHTCSCHSLAALGRKAFAPSICPRPSASQRRICHHARGQCDMSAGRSLAFLLKSQAPLLCTPLECGSPATNSLGAPQTRSRGDGQDAQRRPLMQPSDLMREAAATRASPGKRAGFGAVLRRRPTGRGGLAVEKPQAGPHSAY